MARVNANDQLYGLLADGLYGCAAGMDYKAGAFVSLHADMGFTPVWHLETGLDFSQLGYKPYAVDYDETRSDRLNVYYLQLPVLAVAKVALGEGVSLNMKGGAYAGLGLGGDFETVYHVPGMSLSVDAFGVTRYDSSWDAEEVRCGLSRFDAGLVFGLELEVRRFTVAASYLLGLMDTYRDENLDYEYPIEMRNRSFNVSVGYNFKIK